MATANIKMVDDNGTIKEVSYEVSAEVEWRAIDHFIPCNGCGRIVFHESTTIEKEKHYICTTCKANVSKIEAAVSRAEDMFWSVIADAYPEIKTGDLDPITAAHLSQVMLDATTKWYHSNTPATNGPFGNLNLHMGQEWELENTGGNVMVAYLMFYAFDGEARRIGVSSECICIIDKPFTEFENEVYSWSFGDNPTAFLCAMENYAKHSSRFDFGKIFDDCQTIAKSGLV